MSVEFAPDPENIRGKLPPDGRCFIEAFVAQSETVLPYVDAIGLSEGHTLQMIHGLSAAEALGLVKLDRDRMVLLTELGEEVATLPPAEDPG